MNADYLRAICFIRENQPGSAIEALKEGKVINNLTVVKDGQEAIAILRRRGDPRAEDATMLRFGRLEIDAGALDRKEERLFAIRAAARNPT